MSLSRFRLSSSVGKKFLNGLTGVLLLAFIVAHLAGNLTIFAGQNALNGYAALTHSLGPMLIVIEVALAVVFLAHAASAIGVWRDGRRARRRRGARAFPLGAAATPRDHACSSHLFLSEGPPHRDRRERAACHRPDLEATIRAFSHR